MFRKIGDICSRRDMYFCIENNSKSYGCNWLNTVSECIEFVKLVNHPHIRINLDTGSCFMENEVPNISKDDLQYIQHVQISFPNLDDWDYAWESQVRDIVTNLELMGYSKYYSLEMRTKAKLPFESILKFRREMVQCQKSL